MVRAPFEKPDCIILSHPRSGTHFLLASLRSHPRIHGRGECVLNYGRFGPSSAECFGDAGFRFRNRPGFINIAIVMYPEVSRFEELCGPLLGFKIIHLIRSPQSVAKSVVQMQANKQRYGINYKAHYKVQDVSPPNAPFSRAELQLREVEIERQQSAHRERLRGASTVLEVRYEELAADRQVNVLAEDSSRTLLDFIGVPFVLLTNNLAKTGIADEGAAGGEGD